MLSLASRRALFERLDRLTRLPDVVPAVALAVLAVVLPTSPVDRLVGQLSRGGVGVAVPIVLIGIAAMRVRPVSSRQWHRLSTIVFALGMLFAILALASRQWSHLPSSSAERAVLATLVVVVAALAASSARVYRFASGAWLAGGVLESAVAIGQFLLQKPLGLGPLGEHEWSAAAQADALIAVGSDLWLRAPGLTPHPNILGAYLVVAIAIATGYALSARGRARIPAACLLLIVTAGQLVTFSRASYLSSVLVVLLLIAWAWSRRAASPRRLVGLVAAMASVVAGFVLAYPQLFAARSLVTAMNSGWQSTPYELADFGARLASHGYSLELLAAHPLVGVGAGAYSAGVYSTPLWIGVELGYVGLALWVSWVAVACVCALRRATARPKDLAPAVAFAALAGVLLGSLFNPDVWASLSGALILALSLGFGAADCPVGRGRIGSGAVVPTAIRSPVPVTRRMTSVPSPGRRFARVVPLFLIGIALSGALVAGVAAQPDLVSSSDAISIASRLAGREVASGAIPEWGGATVGPAVAYFDLKGDVAAYVVDISGDEGVLGYVTVSGRAIANPVLEFGRGPSYHRLASTKRLIAAASTLDVDMAHPLYLGALSYYYAARSPTAGEGYLVDMVSGHAESSPTAPAPASLLTPSADLTSGTVSSSAIGLPSYRLLQAPAYLQFLYGDCYVGCAPTAAGTVMGYWADRWFPRLVIGGSSGDYQSAIIRLHDLMGTQCDGQTGFTPYSEVTPAMLAFAVERGYSFSSEYLVGDAATYERFVAELDAARPVQINLNNSRGDEHHPAYGDHSVTGIGYEFDPTDASSRFMIVHDNWVTTERWLRYGVNYDLISYNTLLGTVVDGQTIYLPLIDRD